jgi:arylsulfatase A-like enzyme
LRGETTSKRTLYWHYPHYHGSDWKPGAAIRDGDWKLIEFYETEQTELYNLANDIGEQLDLAQDQPEIRDRLKANLQQWQKRLGAKMPVQNK